LTVTRVNRSYRCGGTVPLGGKPPEPGIGKEHQMGDYAAATLTLIGVSGKEQQVLEVLESGWCLEFGAGGALALSDLSDEIELCDDQCSVGWIFDGCGSSLVDLGVAYEFCQDAKYEYDATVEIFLPGLGVFQSPGSQEGEVHVPAPWIERAIDESESLDQLREALWRLTGKTWRDALLERAKGRSNVTPGRP
jgi:hypothetical protein